MGLSSDLITQFVKATTIKDETKKETTVYGTIVESDSRQYVRLDGSDLLTPISKTSDIRYGDRVTVLIKNHTAVVTGNLTSPSARVAEVAEVEGEVVAVKTLIAEKVDAGTVRAHSARIGDLEADNVTINNTLVAHRADIDTLSSTKLDAYEASITYATITNLNATHAEIDTLAAGYGDFKELTTGRLDAIEADIDSLDVSYANIDFSNIGKAAMEYFYAQSGLIDNVVVGDQTIAGELVGVTINGDRLIGNTVIAEKLVIKGSDGLYYKLNTDGMKVEAEQTDQNSLNGQIIKAKSITATKISVSDLVAFGATIGGFHIGQNSLYSGVKSAVGNTTRGIYMDTDGQMAIGDANNFLKYYKDTDGSYKLAISAKSLSISGGADIETAIKNLKDSVDSLEIGGRNMVENSDFSSGTIGPWRVWGDATSGTREMVAISSHPQFTTGVTVEKTSGGQWGYAQDNIPVTKGCKYVLSAWFKVESGDSVTTIMCQQGNSTDRWTSDEISIETVGTANWYRLYHKFTAVSSSTNVYVGMQGSGSGKITFTGVQLEKGDVMSDWKPYIENVHVGGTNLLRGTQKLDNTYWIDNGATVLSDTIEGGALYSVSTSWCERAYSKLADIEIELDVDYTLSWYAKASSDAYLPMMQFYCTNGTTPIVTRYGSSYQKAVTKEWRRYSHTFRFTSIPTSSTQLRVEPSTSSPDPANAYLIIGAFKLEKGNKATDYSVSPLDVDSDITEAAKTATNYMYYDSTNGLQVGNKRSGSWSGFRTQITSAAFNILNAAGTVLASYGEKIIELGKNATDAVIKFCGGKGRIEYSEDYLQLTADSVRLKGVEIASLYSNYTDSDGVFRNGAVHAAPGQVSMNAGGGSDDSTATINPTNIQMRTKNFYLSGVMNDSDNGGTYVSVAKGTSGIWTYKKYANGDLEMWCSYAISNMECKETMGSLYRTAVFSPSSFPFTVYSPVVTASYESEGYGAFLWATTKATTAKPPNYYLVRSTSATIASGVINFHVFGKWKT